jgi:4'-phosphopantetheinyl transferase
MASHLSSWCQPPERLVVGGGEVHIWRATLSQSVSTVKSFLNILDRDEISRAEGFHFEKDRNRFVVAHGVLRIILSRYLSVPPQAVRFCYGLYGKPALTEDSGGRALRFNMSHSQELGLYAVARDRRVGIDLEYVRGDFASEQIARQFFSPGEVATLCSLPAHLQTKAFFDCWTRKEAYIKAKGQGLSLPLHQFDVSLAPGEPAALLSTRENPQEALGWTLLELTPGSGYVAALAVEGHDWRLNCWQWAAK